jgi:cobalamin biosynthesis protein CbiD
MKINQPTNDQTTTTAAAAAAAAAAATTTIKSGKNVTSNLVVHKQG